MKICSIVTSQPSRQFDCRQCGCSVARAGGSMGGWLHGQVENHSKFATAVAVTGCAALGCWAWKRHR